MDQNENQFAKLQELVDEAAYQLRDAYQRDWLEDIQWALYSLGTIKNVAEIFGYTFDIEETKTPHPVVRKMTE